MIIIATVGRAGSSILTLFFQKCGLNVGSDTWYKAFNAGMENKETLLINNELIKHYVKGEQINHYYVWGDIYKMRYDVIKDPSFVAHPQIIKNWWKARKDLKIIFLHRNAQDVVDSCKRLPEWTGPTYRCFPEMIEAKNDDFLRTVNKMGIPIKIFKFPQFLDGSFIGKLDGWVPLPKDAMNIWKKLVK